MLKKILITCGILILISIICSLLPIYSMLAKVEIINNTGNDIEVVFLNTGNDIEDKFLKNGQTGRYWKHSVEKGVSKGLTYYRGDSSPDSKHCFIILVYQGDNIILNDLKYGPEMPKVYSFSSNEEGGVDVDFH